MSHLFEKSSSLEQDLRNQANAMSDATVKQQYNKLADDQKRISDQLRSLDQHVSGSQPAPEQEQQDPNQEGM